MIAADRRLLQASIKQRRLEIKDREIGHYLNNMNMIATQGALVAALLVAKYPTLFKFAVLVCRYN